MAAQYRGFALGPITHDFAPGVTCLVGANGAGKSTLFRLLAGIEKPSSGSVHVAGEPSHPGVPLIGYLPQELTFPGTATCVDYLRYVAWVYALPRGARDEAVKRSLAAAGLADRAGSATRKLSGGMRRRLGFAHAILHDPAVLLLDEPTAGLDPLQRASLREVIRAEARQRVTVVATHLVEDVQALADTVIVLRAGQVVFTGTTHALLAVAPQDAVGATPLERAITSPMAGAPAAAARELA